MSFVTAPLRIRGQSFRHADSWWLPRGCVEGAARSTYMGIWGRPLFFDFYIAHMHNCHSNSLFCALQDQNACRTSQPHGHHSSLRTNHKDLAAETSLYVAEGLRFDYESVNPSSKRYELFWMSQGEQVGSRKVPDPLWLAWNGNGQCFSPDNLLVLPFWGSS
jgi:hypothetical protein